MRQENIEMYTGAVYRLRTNSQSAVPLHEIQKYFGFSPISVHEMIVKLQQDGFVDYTRYHGVTLTDKGEQIASALIRRHRIWERFLVDQLHLSGPQVHEIACELEHAAPEIVTDQLAVLLGQPEACPHGSTIPQPLEPE